MTEQDKRDIIGFALVGNLLEDPTILTGLDAVIRRLTPEYVVAWLVSDPGHARFKYSHHILNACARVSGEDGAGGDA
jgi:hypothetical protein